MLLALLCALPLTLPDPAPGQEQTPRLGVELAAVAGEFNVTFAELDDALLWRHGRSKDGSEALSSLLDLAVLEDLGRKAGIEVSDKQIAARWGELEREVQEAGAAADLYEYLAQNEITPEVFRRHLRLSIVQEILARRDLGLSKEAPISGEQQTAWLQRVHAERDETLEPFPWEDGVVARSGSVVITRDAFAEHLRNLIPRDELSELAHAIALSKALEARLPDLAPSALNQAIEAELTRRAARVAEDPRFQGVEYERLLEAQGLSLEALRHDPSVRAQALLYILSQRTTSPEQLRKTYEEERERFDARYGEAVEVYALLLHAARFKNDINPRTFSEADAELRKLLDGLDGLEDFQRLVAEFSEDPVTREKKGLLGRVTRGTKVVPEAVRKAAFERIDAARGEDGVADVSGTILGPLHVQGGSLLICLGRRFPAPTWERMAEHVAGELRRRLAEEVLPRGAVAMWFDVH